MRLKELKVFGFKTFAEPTTIEFEPGITAIVGPNGSGKSNLVDAIRWALGEQSSKSLRSGRMDDVIFAGTTKRKPLGMVEVSLLFDNSDGRLPIDFNEVSVTRRGYRAGEIEYYINRNRVRLRDVLDLLGGTGLGAGSYSIVSQGQVDAILSSKPVERRALFEETAGINRFLSRKSEALRRLEQTEANAIRISDLIAELERRIPELDTAVRRAKRYRRLVTRVRELELVRYLRASASRREERARVRETLNLHEERQAATAAHAASLAAELSVVRTELYKQELALEERRVGGQEARARLAELQARFAALEARRDALDAQSRASTADQERASGERSGLGSALAALDARVAPLWARVEDARSVEARIAADVTAARAELDAGFNALREFESALAMTMASAAERRATIAGTEREIGRLREEIARLRAGREEAQREATADRERFARDEQDLLGLEREVVARADELSGLDAQAQADASHLEALNVRLRHLHSEVASDAARLHTLEELEHSLEGHVPGTRAVIEASGRGELAGIRGVVSNVMRVDERYARALDVAFGTALSHIITETTSDARTALAYLSERELGRATFIPLDALNERPARQRPSLEGRAGVIGYADSLVQTQPVHAGVIAALVGAIAVVESLENALTLVREGACEGAVTLGGDLILGAAISGGRYRRERSILARRAQAEALRAKLPEKRERLERLEHDVREATAASEMRNADRERVRLAHADALVTTTDARTRLEALGSEIERLDQTGDESAARERELARQLEEEASRVATLERLADEHLERSGERERLEGDLARCRARVATAEGQQREAALALAGAREAAGAAQAERDASYARLGMLDENAQRATEVREATLREIEALNAEHAEVATAIDAAGHAAAEADRAFADAREERERLSNRASALDGEQRMAQNEERATAAQGEDSRRRLAEIEAELGMLTATFAQNPAPDEELREVETRYLEEPDEIFDDLPRLREELSRLSVTVNLSAETDRDEVAQREAFLRTQMDDLTRARDTLLATIKEIETSTQEQFNQTFARVQSAFAQMFARLFPGGEARIWQTNPEALSETGIEISVQPPGKKMMALAALSGGERAMTAAALIFALIAVKPSPFYLLDEVDAALDEANIDRFSTMVREVARDAQMVLVTHNKRTMELAQRFYGVTMGEPGVSQIVSVSLDDAPAIAEAPAAPRAIEKRDETREAGVA